MKDKNKKEKLRKVKCADLRVYKDNMRPTVFKDKKRREKHKQSLMALI